MYPQREHPLVRRARALAMEQQRQVDSLHLLVIALGNHEAAGHARFAIREVLSPEHCGELADQTTAYILAEVKQQSIPNTSPELTTELEAVMRTCAHDASTRERPITAASILLTMLTQDTHVTRWVQAQHVPVERLVAELRLVADQPDTYTNLDDHDGVLAAAERSRELDRLAETFLGEYVKPIDSTPRLPYATLNVQRLNNVLQTLATAMAGVGGMDVTVCVSTPGSVLALLERVLADRVALRDAYPASQSALRAIREVRIISLSSLLRGAAVDANVDPTRILRAAKRVATKDGAMLIVDHVEALMPQSPPTAGARANVRPPHQGTATTAPPEFGARARASVPAGWLRTPMPLDPPTEPRGFTAEELDKLATEFTRSGKCLVLGYFYCDTETDVRKATLPTTFEQSGVKTMPIQPFDRTETTFLIEKFYRPLWQHNGYEVKRGAFDRVFDLAPYTWNGRQRSSLPMLAIDLASEAQETADQGSAAADNVIEAALHSLPSRRTSAASAPNASAATVPTLSDALGAAERDILALKAFLHPSGWRATRAKLMARLRRTTDKNRFEEQRRYLRTLPSGLLAAHLLADADYELSSDGQGPPSWGSSGLYHARLRMDEDAGDDENTPPGTNGGTDPSGGNSGGNSDGPQAKGGASEPTSAADVAQKAQALNDPTGPGDSTPDGSPENQAPAPPSEQERGARAPTSTRLTPTRPPDASIFPFDHRRRTHD